MKESVNAVIVWRYPLWRTADIDANAKANRHAADATSMDVRLNVAAPRAELWVSHNGTSTLTQKDFLEHPLKALGGEVTVEPYGERGVSLRMRMRVRGAAPSATLSHERIPQPS